MRRKQELTKTLIIHSHTKSGTAAIYIFQLVYWQKIHQKGTYKFADLTKNAAWTKTLSFLNTDSLSEDINSINFCIFGRFLKYEGIHFTLKSVYKLHSITK